MKRTTLGVCAECVSPIVAEHTFEDSPEAHPSPGDFCVSQALGRHWYEEHSHRHRNSFVIARRYLGQNLDVLVIACPVTIWKLKDDADTVARTWALSMIEVCGHEDGV